MSALNYVLKIELHNNALELIVVTLTLPLWGESIQIIPFSADKD